MPLHIQEPAIKNHISVLGLLCSSDGKESACNAGDLNSITLEKEMATHSNILGWRITWTEEPGGLWFMGVTKSWI